MGSSSKSPTLLGFPWHLGVRDTVMEAPGQWVWQHYGKKGMEKGVCALTEELSLRGDWLMKEEEGQDLIKNSQCVISLLKF